MKNKTLIVIDMQKGFMTDDRYIQLNSRLKDYIKRSKYKTIIFTQFKNDRKHNSLYQDQIGWHELMDIDSQEFALDVPKNALIMEKFGYGLS